MSSNYLEINLSEEDILLEEFNLVNRWNNKILPFRKSEVFLKSAKSVQTLTQGEDIKTAFKLSIDITDIDCNFYPGDTIGIIPVNEKSTVEKLLIRLKLKSVADKQCTLQILKDTTKKNATIPRHLPQISSSLRSILSYDVDLQTPPKKLFLKSLLNFTRHPQERDTLKQLCSPNGSQAYQDLISGPGATLLGLLSAFPSCEPPIARILEHLPPLQPRAFSISSSPLLLHDKSSQIIDITFSVAVRSDDGTAKGLCTGWLAQNANRNGFKLPFYFRTPNKFRLPEPQDAAIPIIMIATGTGIAPFRGFLQHRMLSTIQRRADLKGDGKATLFGDAWLFYGCRYSERDCLYRDEFDDYLNFNALTRLNLCYSREINNEVLLRADKHYVQHDIEKYGEDFVDFLTEKRAIVYVCGDAKTMMKDVRRAIVNNLVCFGANKMSMEDADNYLKELELNNRFITDSWV